MIQNIKLKLEQGMFTTLSLLTKSIWIKDKPDLNCGTGLSYNYELPAKTCTSLTD